MLFSLAIKGLRRSWRQFGTVALVIFVGLLGPLLAASLRTSADLFLRVKAREFLSADLAWTSLRPITPEEVREAKQVLDARQIVQEVEFVTMASGVGASGVGASGAEVSGGGVSKSAPATGEEGRASTLVEVKAIDAGYPVYGTFRLRRSGSTNPNGEIGSTRELSESPKAWVFPEVLVQLGLRLGDKIRLGKSEFEIAGEVLDGPGALRAGFGIAPRLYIGRDYVRQTGLEQYGSQLNYRVYFRLPDRADATVAATLLKSAVPAADLFIRTPADSAQGFERFVQFFSRYLAVVTLIVFALSWMSAFYILQIFLLDRLRDAAIFITLGGGRWLAGSINVVQVICVSLLALSGATAVVGLALAAANRVATSLLPEGFVLSLHSPDVIRFAFISLLSSAVFNVPFFVRLISLNPKELLGEGSLSAAGDSLSWRGKLLAYAPMAGVFWILAGWLMGSWRQGGALLGGILGASLVGWFVGRALFRAAHAAVRARQGTFRLAATNLSRGRFGTDLCFLALTLAALTLNVVPHLLASVTGEIEPQSERELPELFLFNIPEGDVEELRSFTQGRGGELRYLSPMILARLEKVNGAPPEQEFFLKFPVRVSYRAELIPSEAVVSGNEFRGSFDPAVGGIPSVSVEVRYAERNGLNLGDRLEFDVQGVPIEGRIENLRRVRWTDFHPNFFMEFQTGVLEDAPKTFLANVNLEDPSSKSRFQFDLIRAFPDLSVVDISRTIDRVFSIVRSMIGPVRQSAWVSVLMSFLVLLAVVGHNLRLRANEIDVLKVLGAEATTVRSIIVIEYFLTSVFAAATGTLFAIAISHGVATRIFDIEGRIAWSQAALSFAIIVLATTAIAWRSTGRALSRAGFVSSRS